MADKDVDEGGSRLGSPEDRDRVNRLLAGADGAWEDLAWWLKPAAERRIRAVMLQRKLIRTQLDMAPLLEDVMGKFLATLFQDKEKVLGNWSPERGSLEKYLVAVAHNVARNYVAKQRRRLEKEQLTPEGDVEAISPAPSAESAVMTRQVALKLLEHFEPEDRKMVYAYFLERRTAKEVGALFDRTETAVHQWAMRTRRRMADLYEEITGEQP